MSSKLAFSIEEAAEAVSYSTDTIRRAIRNNDLSVKYANSKPVIMATELEAWLTALPSEPPKR